MIRKANYGKKNYAHQMGQALVACCRCSTMKTESQVMLACVARPLLSHLVATAGRQQLAVRRPGHAPHALRVAFEHRRLLQSRHLDLLCVVVCRAKQRMCGKSKGFDIVLKHAFWRGRQAYINLEPIYGTKPKRREALTCETMNVDDPLFFSTALQQPSPEKLLQRLAPLR